MLNPSAVLYGPHDVRIEDRPVPNRPPIRSWSKLLPSASAVPMFTTTSTAASGAMWCTIR